MTGSKRTRMTPEARRLQLIEEGLAMAADRPLDHVSVEAVAEAVGVSRALIFHYFDTKQDFHVAMAREQSQRMLQATEPDFELGDPIEVLRGTIRGFVDFVTQNRNLYLALMRGSASSDPTMQAVFDETRSVMVRRTLGSVQLVGLEPTPLVELAINGWLAFSEDVTIRWLTDPTVTRDELLELITVALPSLGAVAGEMSGSHVPDTVLAATT
ncbi:TetR/AcrR family transcriptional regulator [Williamsia deligens]|uniref:TetR/AcrR family transcriptional regulator n=1 Tax=Williamsia deligens TaxID=321325 RepID=A0ABW3GFB8_9NOCA|nr:TetR/AcrR family transcriptional regulator [Williamsia deligens]MCP2196241.1 transcriptional regulator, TetR family [Williamsia deligens]